MCEGLGVGGVSVRGSFFLAEWGVLYVIVVGFWGGGRL